MTTQSEKGRIFRALHERDHAFVIPNPWDVGSAKLLAQLGFEALATTSAGFAFSVGQQDNCVNRDQMMTHLAAITEATDLPVSADLGNGFGDAPDVVVETINRAAAAGVVGGSIEDASGRVDEPIYPIELAAERIRAAVEACRALPFQFTLTARAENYLWGKPNLRDTIKRLQVYQDAGADVLYAPGLTSTEDIRGVVNSLERPVNVLMGLKGMQLSVDEVSDMGAKRISVGSALARAAMGAFVSAAREMREKGTFSFANDAISFGEINAMFQR